MSSVLERVRPGSVAQADEGPGDATELWNRMARCAALVERGIRKRLSERCATTLPRFDLLAELERSPSGLRMGELSQRLMVTGGNVTGIVARLLADGLVDRVTDERDRRAFVVRLTELGLEAYRDMLDEHGRAVAELLGAVGASDRSRLVDLLVSFEDALRVNEKPAGDRVQRVASDDLRSARDCWC